MARVIGIVDSGRYAVEARAFERSLFETVGRWVPTESEPAAKLLFARRSRQHAWHVELWERVVPLLHDVDLDALATGLDHHAEDLAAAGGGGTASRLGAYRAAVEALCGELGRWQAAAAPESDGPALRVIALVLADLADASGEITLLQAQVGGGRP